MTSCFSQIPEPNDLDLPIVDKRQEINDFNIEEGYKTIGMIDTPRPSERR